MNEKMRALSIYLFVSDIDESLTFYNLLGMNVEKVSESFGRACLDDDVVPPEMTERYRQRVGDPDRLSVRFFEGTDHMDVIDPAHDSWPAVVAELADRLS